jgi:hypothetical protein
VSARPCECHRGAACTYRDEPPGDPDTGHCQRCGAWMEPASEGLEVDDRFECPYCRTVYVVGEPEDA